VTPGLLRCLIEMIKSRSVVVALLCFGVAACTKPTPPIAQGLPKDFGPTPYFDGRVKERFPIGSNEVSLLAELRDERFEIKETNELSSDYRLSARYEVQNFPCTETWTVLWTAEQGRITDIKGRYSGQICL
jgi:hypothetical protein